MGLGLVWAAAVGAASAASAAQVDSLLARAEAALESGELGTAGRALRAARRAAPDDPRVLVLAGRVNLERPWGRFRALESLRAAAAAEPESLEPWYWIARVGLALRGDDGEGIARPALERVLAADPLYRDAWALWLSLYRGEAERAAMIEALAPRAVDPEVAGRIAWLRMESGDLFTADSILADLAWRSDPRWAQRRAEIAFLSGRDSAGRALYEEALALAPQDSTGELWEAVAGIATPAERIVYEHLDAAARPGFLRGFWARRDPNLRTEPNERIPEHFRRRAEARRRFALRHPLSRLHLSDEYRAFVSILTGRPGGDEILPAGVNLVDRVDDRGLVWIRHGEPSRIVAHAGGEEWWFYEGSPGFVLRFAHPDPMAAPVNEIVFQPAGESTTRDVERALSTDATDLPAPLEFAFWFARFRDRADSELAVLYLFVDSLSAAAALFDDLGRFSDRATAAPGSPLVLSAPPGEYLLGLDAERAGRLGRHRVGIWMGAFPDDSLSVSDVLVAGAEAGIELGAVATEGAARDRFAAHALPGLRARADRPFWIYAEVYGAATAGDGRARYEARYALVRRRGWLGRLLGGEDRVELRLTRETRPRPGGVIEEAVRIDAGRLEPGTYELGLRVAELGSGRLSEARTIRLEIVEP